jgi:hypothetical protein
MRAESDDPDSFICGVVTDMLPLVEAGNKPGPGALIFQPIYPAGNKTVVSFTRRGDMSANVPCTNDFLTMHLPHSLRVF